MVTKTLKDKKVLYNQVFGNPTGKEVLADLRVYCYATKTTGGNVSDSEMREHEGRRQVFMQIMNTMKIEFEDYYDYDPEDYLDG